MSRSKTLNNEKADFHQLLFNNISQEESEVLRQVLDAIRQIKYGYIQVTIQDARVVQIDRTEKQRFDRK